MTRKIGVIGLGYVGLPLALAFARKFQGTVGFDISESRVRQLRDGKDSNDEESGEDLKSTSLVISSDLEALRGCNFFVVGVPTPIDENNNPDLIPLRGACEVVGKVLSKGSIVVFESTVYPGVTEDICGRWLEEVSGLCRGVDFKLGYSPERINPGDKEHTLVKITKVVSGEDTETLQIVSDVYGAVIEAGVYQATSIKVAEAAKVIENTQRDLNIALMNELAIIFDRMNISTKEVLDAAATKWNFLRFSPGLVGGHCIGVDPYYLTTKAEQLGYHPQVILAGRRINDGMGAWVAQRVIKLMVTSGVQIKSARVGVLGITFKENVSDIRNSRVPDIIRELKEFGVTPVVHDPLADPEKVHEEYNLDLVSWSALQELDAIILAVAHAPFTKMAPAALLAGLRRGGVVADIKAALQGRELPEAAVYWSL
jgi:UDP-N-acetyl-D-glucosamine/UDP-N-acetyl-D-galactosamine dehydrogenase